jgi:hypothetical protein
MVIGWSESRAPAGILSVVPVPARLTLPPVGPVICVTAPNPMGGAELPLQAATDNPNPVAIRRIRLCLLISFLSRAFGPRHAARPAVRPGGAFAGNGPPQGTQKGVPLK